MDRISPIAPRSRSEPPLAPIPRDPVQARRRDQEAEDAARKRRREAEREAERRARTEGPGDDGHIDVRV
jgi:hypothetical protein